MLKNNSGSGLAKAGAIPVPIEKSEKIVTISELLPSPLPLIPVSQTTLFPGMLVPFILPDGKLVRTVEHALEHYQGYLGIVLGNDPSEKAIASGPNTSFTGLPADGTVAAALFHSTESAPTIVFKTTRRSKDKGDKEFYRFGVVCKILKKINLPESQVSVLVQGVQRFLIKEIVSREPLVVAQVEYLPEILEKVGDHKSAKT